MVSQCRVERRARTRVEVELWVEETRGEEIYFRRAENLSALGIFFAQAIPYPIHTPVTLRFNLSFLEQGLVQQGDIIVHGQVANVRHLNESRGMGVYFKRFEGDGENTLYRYLAALQEELIY